MKDVFSAHSKAAPVQAAVIVISAITVGTVGGTSKHERKTTAAPASISMVTSDSREFNHPQH
jgi:hypothetical protein